MGTLTLTLASPAIPGSPITKTIAFSDADVPDILAAAKWMKQDQTFTMQDIATYFSDRIATELKNRTQQYRASQQAPAAPPSPVITVS